MTMPTVIETTVYPFNELSDAAKDKARDWFRTTHLDSDWWDRVVDDLKSVGKILGFNLKHVFFDVYERWASIEGYWMPEVGAAKKVKKDYPHWAELHAVAKEVGRLTGQFALKGEKYTSHDLRAGRRGGVKCENEEVKELAENFAALCLTHITAEWEYLNSDAAVDENIVANEYTFTAEGKRFG
jgi:hypothetical protein